MYKFFLFSLIKPVHLGLKLLKIDIDSSLGDPPSIPDFVCFSFVVVVAAAAV